MNKKQCYTAAKYTFVAAAAAVAIGMSHPKEAEAAPNVILIYADDLGYGDTRLTSSTSVSATPNIKSIADNGVNFTKGYVASPVCMASRAALMSGTYPSRLGFDSFYGIPGGISSYYPTNGTAPSDATYWVKNTNSIITSSSVVAAQTQNVKEYDAATTTYVKRTPQD